MKGGDIKPGAECASVPPAYSDDGRRSILDSPTVSDEDEGREIILALLGEIKSIKVDDISEVDEEKMWRILNTLEEWKKSPNLVLRNLKLISEIKAALLPLIAALNRPKEPLPDEVLHENELANFDDDFKLILNALNWKALHDDSRHKTSLSTTISMLGDTHVGKSTLVGAMIEDMRKLNSELVGLEIRPEVAEPHQNAPTTANVNYYLCDNFVEEQSALFLDLEGENGGKPPKSAMCEKLMQVLESMGVATYQERRRKAVADNLSRLAFVTSDIVIFMWNESFANASYMKRVRELAVASTESVDSATSPSLILVYNKCGLDEEFDIERCTAQFFDNVENEEIRRLYCDVACICIPHLDQVKKIRKAGQPTMLIDGEEIFEVQVRKLNELCQSMLQRKMNNRESQGTLFSFHVWVKLFKVVLEKFDEKLRMSEILMSVLKPDNEFASRVFQFFLETYSFGESFCSDRFLQCREAALQMLAVQFVDHLRSKQAELDKFIINSFKAEVFQLEAEQMFLELAAFIDKLAPCTATLTGPDGTVVHCTQERMDHSGAHRASKRVYYPSTAPSLKTRYWDNMKSWLKIGYRPSWAGSHAFSYPHSSDDELAMFKGNIEILSKVLPSSYFMTKIGILQKALLGGRRNGQNNNGVCWLCLKNFPTRQFYPCRHVMCAACFDTTCKLREDQVAVTLEQYTEESYGTIRRNCCVLCDQPYTKVVYNSVRSARTKLQGRFDRIFEHADLAVVDSHAHTRQSPE